MALDGAFFVLQLRPGLTEMPCMASFLTPCQSEGRNRASTKTTKSMGSSSSSARYNLPPAHSEPGRWPCATAHNQQASSERPPAVAVREGKVLWPHLRPDAPPGESPNTASAIVQDSCWEEVSSLGSKVTILALGWGGRAGNLLHFPWLNISLHSQLWCQCCWYGHKELHQLTPCSDVAQSTPHTASYHALQIQGSCQF